MAAHLLQRASPFAHGSYSPTGPCVCPILCPTLPLHVPAERREVAGAPGTQLPSFPVEWRHVECGSLVEGDIYLRLAPGKPVR